MLTNSAGPVFSLAGDPIKIPGECAPADGEYFRSSIVTERAVLIAGGPRQLCVFQIYDQSRLWYAIAAQAAISGYAVSASTLYAQDGPVLSAWDLTQGGCIAAINVAAGTRWTPATVGPAAPPASLWQTPAGRNTIFSAPVVRTHQTHGAAVAQLFVLGQDGTLHWFDNKLNHLGGKGYAVPARTELTIVEIPQPDRTVACHLLYVAADGSIHKFDVTTSAPSELSGWPAQGAPAQVLPLRYVDGLLFGGGVLGADAWVRSLDPAAAPILTFTSERGNGFSGYEVQPGEKLVLFYNHEAQGRTYMHLLSYGGPPADRAVAHLAMVKTWPVFCPGTGVDDAPPSPRLLLTVDQVVDPTAPASTPSYHVFVANTIVPVKPELVTTTYPPRPQSIETGTFELDPASLPRISMLRCAPVFDEQMMYVIARGDSDALVAYEIAHKLYSLIPAAQTELARYRVLASPISLYVEVAPPGRPFRGFEGPLEINGTNVHIFLNGDGVAWLDARFSGATATIDTAILGDGWTSTSCTLQQGAPSSEGPPAINYIVCMEPE